LHCKQFLWMFVSRVHFRYVFIYLISICFNLISKQYCLWEWLSLKQHKEWKWYSAWTSRVLFFNVHVRSPNNIMRLSLNLTKLKKNNFLSFLFNYCLISIFYCYVLKNVLINFPQLTNWVRFPMLKPKSDYNEGVIQT